MTDELAVAKQDALSWVARFFPRWADIRHKVPTIGALLCRPTGDLLRSSRGWRTFEDGLRRRLTDLSGRQADKVIRWLSAMPVDALGQRFLDNPCALIT